MKSSDFTLFHVFTGENARGNPAAVRLVETLPSFEEHLQMPAPCKTRVYLCEIEGSQEQPHFAIRWLNDKASIQRCGHGTLAAAAYLSQRGLNGPFLFSSAAETLQVSTGPDGFLLELPVVQLREDFAPSLSFD